MTDASQNRRDFLKTTAAAGAALTTGLGLVPGVYAAAGDTIKVGLIGCGGRGTQAAENVLSAAPGVELVAIGDVFKFRADGARRHLTSWVQGDETAKQHGNKVNLPEQHCYVGLDAYEKVINTPGVNYVILATPPGFRPVHLQAAVAAGKNIFTEKPVGVDGPGIRKVLAAYEQAKEKGLAIAAGTQRRHQAGYIETIKRVQGGEIGDLLALRCFWNQGRIWFRKRDELRDLGIPDSDLAYQLHNWYHFVWVCGDHICEQHVHNLDVCNWVMNSHPARVVGAGGRATLPTGDPAELGQIYDHFVLDYEYPNGVHMLSMCRQIDGTDGNLQGVSGVSEAFVGTKGACQADQYILNGKRVGARRKETNPYVQEHTDLIESIRAGKPINELKNVAESTLTAIMGRMACYTGKAVTWDKALNSREDTMPQHLAWDMKLEAAPVAVPGKTPLV